MPYKQTIFLLISSFCLLTVVHSQDTEWSPEDIIYAEYLSSPNFSEDGQMVVWTKRRALKKEDKFVSDIYLSRLGSGKNPKTNTVRMTYSDESDSNPQFDKEAKYIYFSSSRDKGKKLWRLNVLGGEAEEVHEFENGFSRWQWLDETTILFIAEEGKSLYELESEKDNTKVVEDTAHWEKKRIFSFNLKSKQINRVTENNWQVVNYAISQDGNYLVYTISLSPDYGVDANPKPVHYLKNLQTGEKKRILKGLQTPGSFQFTEDNDGFYFTATNSSDPEWSGAGIEELYFWSLANDNYEKVDLNWENGLKSFYLSGNDVIAEMANGPYRKVLFYSKNSSGWDTSEIDWGGMDKNIVVMGMNKLGNRILFNYSTASSLPEYYVADFDKGRRGAQLENVLEIIELNKGLKKKKIAKSEVIYWEGAKEEEVNGILYYPKNYDPNKKYPLILSIHGGPSGVDMDSWSERWSTYPQIYTEKGAFVLKPNYHGSSNHGKKFVESIKNGNYYSLEQIDLYNGIQYLVDKKLVDINQLGLMGWSNGAILTTWMTLKYPDMFKAAAPGAGDINWTSDYGTCAFGVSFDQSYFGGAPWDDTNGKHYNEWYINNSPLFDIEKIRTPTIIFHGSEDRAVPRDQGWEYYRGLQQVGEAPVRFLWFPGQPHGLQKISHQLRKMKEEIRWFDTYLFETYEAENEALKEGSPLSQMLWKTDNITSSDKIGKMSGNDLVPVMIPVKPDSISISAFEITVAQVEASGVKSWGDLVNKNRPALGMTKAEIESYIDWLNKKLEAKYRLPNKKEALALHKMAKANYQGQNNLNTWAGYKITAPDAESLINEVQSSIYPNFIKEVGSFKAIKLADNYIFDLGGNVKEYYQNGSEWAVYDFGALDFVDSYQQAPTEKSRTEIGFRLVLEK